MSETPPPNSYARVDQWPEGPFRVDSDPALLAAVEVIAEVSNRVYQARTRRRWSQERLARESGVSRFGVARLETGSNWPQVMLMMRICAALDIRVTTIDEGD